MNPQATKQLEKGKDRDADAFTPAKNRFRSKKGNQAGDNAKNGKFAGLNKDELEGVVISESNQTPTAQQFDALMDAVIVYAGTRNAKVKISLRTMKYLTNDDFKPAPPDPSLYTKKDGSIDSALQQGHIDVWKSECTTTYKSYTKYKESIEELFEAIMGQLDKEIVNNLEGMPGWKGIDDQNDTIELIKTLRELCYRNNNSKIHPVEDLIRKILRFLQSRQKQMDVLPVPKGLATSIFDTS